MSEQMWKSGDVITAERLNRMQEIAQEAKNEGLAKEMQELALFCDEQGKIVGGQVSFADANPIPVTVMPMSNTPTL